MTLVSIQCKFKKETKSALKNYLIQVKLWISEISKMTTASRSNRGVARVNAKLKEALETGNYYEAHQMYRTLYFRLVTDYSNLAMIFCNFGFCHRLLGQKKYGELEPMLYQGAITLFEANEIGSGTDLSKLYIQVLDEGHFEANEDHFQKVAK